jgi:hypothetical protein
MVPAFSSVMTFIRKLHPADHGRGRSDKIYAGNDERKRNRQAESG